MTSRIVLLELARNPSAYARYQLTGRLPEVHVSRSPLITLMEAVGPRFLAQLRRVTIDQRLGYSGSRDFQWGSQVMRWLKPPGDSIHAPLSESWRIKRFQQRLYLEDLLECVAHVDGEPDMYRHLRHLRRPAARPAAGVVNHGDAGHADPLGSEPPPDEAPRG